MKRRLSLGLDLSTQSLSAVVLDIDSRTKVAGYSLDYNRDERLNTFGIRKTDYILPPRTSGEADQPPLMFLTALDALFTDIKTSVDPGDIVVINTSGQQHGHVYLNDAAPSLFARLQEKESANSNLATLLHDSFAYDRAPIWMTANTKAQADFLRESVGRKGRLIQLSGSDAQLRFTGQVIRSTAEQFPDVYRKTRTIQLLSTFIPAILAGYPEIPTDFGNACGMSLMNYRRKQWSDILLQALSRDLHGGKRGLRKKLPGITAPDSIVGTIVEYFVRKYGFSPTCRIAAGSGDNPQSKVLIRGDLLSLGSSFVNMVTSDGKTMDMSGAACAMYDGVGRPFMFGCRTNGALVWDQVRELYGLNKEDYAPAETALQQTSPGKNIVLWQPRDESFPLSGSFAMVRPDNIEPGLGQDYAGIIESSLAAVYRHSKAFSRDTAAPLYVMGGATGSPGILRRVVAIWKRPVTIVGKGGAALGAAVAGISAYMKAEGKTIDIEATSAALLPRGTTIQPRLEDVAAFHQSGGYLEKFADIEDKLLKNSTIAI
jgi:xylulokinase